MAGPPSRPLHFSPPPPPPPDVKLPTFTLAASSLALLVEVLAVFSGFKGWVDSVSRLLVDGLSSASSSTFSFNSFRPSADLRGDFLDFTVASLCFFLRLALQLTVSAVCLMMDWSLVWAWAASWVHSSSSLDLPAKMRASNGTHSSELGSKRMENRISSFESVIFYFKSSNEYSLFLVR